MLILSLRKNDMLTTQPRLNYLKDTICEQAEVIKNEFKKDTPNYELIKESFYLFSWRINEISWKYKYEMKNVISEELWNLFNFIGRYLTQMIKLVWMKFF